MRWILNIINLYNPWLIGKRLIFPIIMSLLIIVFAFFSIITFANRHQSPEERSCIVPIYNKKIECCYGEQPKDNVHKAVCLTQGFINRSAAFYTFTFFVGSYLAIWSAAMSFGTRGTKRQPLFLRLFLFLLLLITDALLIRRLGWLCDCSYIVDIFW